MSDTGSGTTRRKMGLFSATSIVVANIIGTGVFGSIGFQALGLHTPFSILVLWLIGGFLALCGALTYGELASAIPRSGGEYNFLSRLYHPVLGFLSGFVSLFAGFAAPIAASAFLFGGYTSTFLPGVPPQVLATGIITLATVLHSLELQYGAKTQNVFTVLKVCLIVGFIGFGLFAPALPDFTTSPGTTGWGEVLSGSFAVSLVFVAFAYSGWNAAAYVTSEVEKPRRTVPRALLLGTAIVTLLYVGLHIVFLRTVPLTDYANAALAGQPEFGSLSANVIFGETGGKLVSGLIAVALVSSVSSMVMIGPRVTAAAGEDFPLFAMLAKKNKAGVPALALWLQWAIAITILWTQSFSSIITYIGFTLSLFTFLTVIGVFILRMKGLNSGEFKTPGYPVTPILFLLLTGWMIVHLVTDKPYITLYGLGTLVVGAVVYYIAQRRKPKVD